MPLLIIGSSVFAECSRIQSPCFLHLLPVLIRDKEHANHVLVLVSCSSLASSTHHDEFVHVASSRCLADMQAKAVFVFLISLCLTDIRGKDSMEVRCMER